MAEEDNFDDLDIYGDGTGEDYTEAQDAHADTTNATETRSSTLDNTYDQAEQYNGGQESGIEGGADQHDTSVKAEQDSTAKQEPDLPTQAISSTIGETTGSSLPKQAPIQQGVKRKEGTTDEREVAPGATTALLISDLHWYQDEDDVRGWCNQAEVEDEIKEITFNEHKVNGKSKGQVFVSLQTPQAATALKNKLDSYGAATNGSDSNAQAPGGARKHTANFHPPNNPYKTLPKENPNRRGGDTAQNRGGFQARGTFGNNRGGFNRGGMNQTGGFNQNRNFSNPAMGGGFNNANNNMGGAFGGGAMGGMGGTFNNFNRGGGFGMNRGAMMNRGGRGGAMMGGMGGMGMPMGGNMMGGMMGGMGGMGMGGMNMGMPNMGMGGGFQQGQFNQPGFQGNMGGNDWGNHPNKRQRQE